MTISQISRFSGRHLEKLLDCNNALCNQSSLGLTARTRTFLAVAGLLTLASMLRLFLLTNQSFWFDEGATLAMTDSVDVRHTYYSLMTISGGDKFQPLYFYLLSVWRAIFGDSEFALRFFSVIPGVLTPIVVYLAAKPLFGERHALLSAIFLVCSGFCISYSQELRPYGLLLFIAALQFMVLSPVLAEPERVPANRLLLAFITMLACFASILLVLFSVVIALAHLIGFRQWKVWIKTWAPACVVCLPVLLYYWTTPTISDVSADAINSTGMPIWKNLIFSQYGHLAGQTFGPTLESLRTLDSFTNIVATYAMELVFLTITCAILFVCACVNIKDAAKSPSAKSKVQFLIVFYIVSLLGAIVLAAYTNIHWMPRHSVYLMIPLSLLLPLAISGTNSERPGRWNKLKTVSATSAFATLLLINLYASSNYFFNSDHWRDDYRSAAAYLQQTVGEDDQSFMLWGEPYLVSYYGHEDIESLWRLEDEDLILSHITRATNADKRVFISINREYSWARHSPELIQLLESSFEFVPSAQFNNFNIYQLDKKKLSGELIDTQVLN